VGSRSLLSTVQIRRKLRMLLSQPMNGNIHVTRFVYVQVIPIQRFLFSNSLGDEIFPFPSHWSHSLLFFNDSASHFSDRICSAAFCSSASSSISGGPRFTEMPNASLSMMVGALPRYRRSIGDEDESFTKLCLLLCLHDSQSASKLVCRGNVSQMLVSGVLN
jgi:hypothetical protein